MAEIRNVKVFEANIGTIIGRVTRPFQGTPISAAAEARVMRQVRNEFKEILQEVVEEAYSIGGAPYRTGRARQTMLNGGRVFGTSFNSLRGHILGPSYIAKLEHGGVITPKRARALAIPMEAALRPDGTPKLPGPRSWQNIRKTFIYTNRKTGNKFIAYKGSERLTILYALVPEARFTAQHFLRDAWNRNKYKLMEALGQALMVEMLRVDLGTLARVTTKKGRYTAAATRLIGAGRRRP